MIRVVVVDDHHIVRQGIRALLERSDDIEVVGEAEDGLQAVQLAQEMTPDVVVMDVAMPGMNGNEAAQRLQALGLGTEVVILSMHADEALVRQALRSGARGYVLKRGLSEELALAVRAATREETYLSPAVSRYLVEDYLIGQESTDEVGPLAQLSPREREVLQLIAEGNNNRQIGGILEISVKTVEYHRSNLMTKLEIDDVPGLICFATRHGLVFLDE